MRRESTGKASVTRLAAVGKAAFGARPGEDEQQLFAEVLEQLSIALHELQVTADELREQNEALTSAEGTIARERERYRELYDFGPDGYLVTKPNGIIRECNLVTGEILACETANLPGKPLAMFFPMSHRRPLRTLINEMAPAAGGLRTFESPMIRTDDTVFSAVLRVIPARNALSGEPELRWTLRDVTHEEQMRRALVSETEYRQRAEQSLLRSEALFRHLVEHATDLVYELDESGRFTYCNEQAVHRMLGYSESELIGRPLTRIVRPGRRKSVQTFISRLFKQRSAHSYIEFPALAKDGREVWLGQHAAVISTAERGSSLEVICRDITDQMQRVQQLESAGQRSRDLSAHLQTQVEAERARIAREIHDELGAALTVVRMELSVPRDGDAARENGERNEHLLRRIDAAIESVRRICSDLRPSLLDNMGLCAAIEWLAQDVQERTNLRCEANLEGLTHELDSDRATALFRIVQEAITNTIRHAKASNLTIRQRTRGDDIVIEIADDGQGVKPEEQVGRSAYGIAGMHERAKAFGGTVRVHGGPRGTQVSVHMPASPPRSGGTKGRDECASS